MNNSIQPFSRLSVKPHPVTVLQLADHLLNEADERWPGNLWEHLERMSVMTTWVNRLLNQVAPYPWKRMVMQEALQMSWSEDRDFHIPEYFEALPKITAMVRRIA